MAKAKSELSYRRIIQSRMESVGTFRQEYAAAIDRLAKLYVQREKVEAQFLAAGGEAVVEHTNKAGATNLTKSPYLSALSEIDSQLISLERELGLTPTGGRKVAQPKKEPGSNFAAALSEALSGAGA